MTPDALRRMRTGSAILSEIDVATIKANLNKGYSARVIAEAYNVALSTIRKIARGETWNWVAPLGQPRTEPQEPVAEVSDETIAASQARLMAMLEADGIKVPVVDNQPPSADPSESVMDKFLAQANKARELKSKLDQLVDQQVDEEK